jgi:hypothetical protein
MRAKFKERKTPLYSTSCKCGVTEALPSDGCGLHSRSRSDRFPLLRLIAVITVTLPSDVRGDIPVAGDNAFLYCPVIVTFTAVLSSI